MAKGNSEPPNICFDCKYAYADKCDYIKNKEFAIVRKCTNYEPDFIVAGPKAVAAKLGLPISKFHAFKFEMLEEIAEKQGYIIYLENGYKLRKKVGPDNINYTV